MPKVSAYVCDHCQEDISVGVGASWIDVVGTLTGYSLPDQTSLDAFRESYNRDECRTVKSSGGAVFCNKTCLKAWIDTKFA